MVTGEVEDRQVERRIMAPGLLPADGVEEGRLAEAAFDPLVEDLLRRARQHLDGDDERPFPLMKGV